MNNAENKADSTSTAAHESYDPAYFEPLFAIEERHFWFCARNEVIRRLTQQIIAPLPGDYRLLEVGCGTGNVLQMLRRMCAQGRVYGMDLFREGLRFAQTRSTCALVQGALVQGDIHCAPFTSGFHIVCLFDVLEHLPDDDAVLAAVRTVLVPGGVLMLTAPAHASLWSYFDAASRHYRRYELAEIEAKLSRAGYRVEYATQYMALLFPLVWLGRRLAALTRRRAPRESAVRELANAELRITPVVNDVLAWLLRCEAALIARRWRLPIGASLLVVARKDIDSGPEATK